MAIAMDLQRLGAVAPMRWCNDGFAETDLRYDCPTFYRIVGRDGFIRIGELGICIHSDLTIPDQAVGPSASFRSHGTHSAP